MGDLWAEQLRTALSKFVGRLVRGQRIDLGLWEPLLNHSDLAVSVLAVLEVLSLCREAAQGIPASAERRAG